MSTSLGGRRQNGRGDQPSPARNAPAPRDDQAPQLKEQDPSATQPGGEPVSVGPVSGWRRRLLSVIAAVRWLSVVGLFLASIASFTSYGSDIYRNGQLHEPVVLVVAMVAGLAGFAAWVRFNADRSSQNLFLFLALSGLVLLYSPNAILTSGGTDPDHLLFGPMSRTIFGLGLAAAVAGIHVPAITRLPSWIWAVAVLAMTSGATADLVIGPGLVEELYNASPRVSVQTLEAIALLCGLVSLAWASRTWWRTRRPFQIYLIGSASALSLGAFLFISTQPWEGRWWVAHFGLFVSAVVMGEGMVAETFRRGKLSEVMDLGGLSQLAESTVDTMRDGLALHDAEGNLVGWNPAAERITGWSREIAAMQLPTSLPEGPIQLTHERWVDVRRFTVHQNGYHYFATLFTDVTERRRAEEALRESEERYRSLVEASPDAVLLTDVGGRILLCNRRAAALHGYETGDELVGTNCFDLIDPEDRERAMANAMRSVQAGGIRDVQYRMVGRDERTFLAEYSASVIRDPDGKPRSFTAVLRDITERKRTEEALQRSEEHFRSLTENLSDVILILDSDGTIVYESPSVERVLGHKPDQRIGRKVFDFAHPDDVPAIAEAFQSAIQQPGTLHTAVLRVRHEEGSWRDLECVGRIRTGDAGQAVAIITARDVTERKMADQALRDSEERYRGLVQACPDAVALMALDGRIILCNEQAATLHGFKAVDDVLGLNGFHFIAPEHRQGAIASTMRTVQSGAVTHVEYDVLRRDGSRFPADISASRILDTEGQPVGLTAVWRDISDRRRAERELRKTNALVQLLGSVALAANEAADLRSILDSTLAGVCPYAGWAAGHAFVLSDAGGGQIESSGVWHAQRPRVIQPLRAATKKATFTPEATLAGAVTATGKPAWINDLPGSELPRARVATAAGIKAAYAFPVLVQDEVVAVLEFFSEEFEEPDDALLELMAGIGTQLGRVVERKRARDEIDRFFTLSLDMLGMLGFDGNFKRVNSTLCETLGYTEDEILSKPYLELVHPDDMAAVTREAQRLARGSSSRAFEIRTRCKDGSYRWIQWNATAALPERIIYAHGRDVTERKQSDEALQKAADEIRDLYNAAPCGYHSLDRNGAFVRINDTELEWLGYKRGQVIGKMKIGDVLTPESRRAFQKSLPAFRKRGWVRGLEVEFVRSDGSTFPALLSSTAVRDADGRFVMTRSTVFDITERQKAENELRESETRSRSIIATSHDAFVAIDESGVITDWNAQAENTFGWSRKEALGKTLSETIIPHGQRAAHRRGIKRFLTTGKTRMLNRRIELSAIHRDGHEFPVEVTISPLQVGDTCVFNAFIRDITEHKQTEEIRSRLAAIVESSDDAIVGTTLGGVVTSWNAGAERLYGYAASEAIGRRMNFLVPPGRKGEFRSILAREKAGERVEHFETVRRKKDGSLVDVSLTISPIHDAESRIVGVSNIARDVGARKRAEELARHADDLARSNADLEQFAYVASHDLQEPLRMVTSYCDLLQRRYRGKLDDDADDFIAYAVDGARRMQELVRGLLAYSRVGPHGKTLQMVEVDGVLDRALANLKVAIEESGAVVTHGKLPVVAADPTQLEHVLQNLIGNAVKFRRDDEPPRVRVRAVRKGHMWQISIKDNGIGIDQQYSEKIFAIFQRLHGRGKYLGTGLGLAICKKIVERHGGRIWFDSVPGAGSTFHFTLPAERKEA
jgi:PAS domain S-box-containing protein